MTTLFNIAKIVAGTYVPISEGKSNPVIAWVQRECRFGSLKPVIEEFATEQQEILDPKLVLVENVESDHIECFIPCRLSDHESAGTFMSEVRFTLNPTSGKAIRC